MTRQAHRLANGRFAADCDRPIAGPHGVPVSLGVGITCGPVVAGTVGAAVPSCGLWGDTVNGASRPEALAPANAILTGGVLADRLSHDFVLAERDAETIKGRREPLRTYLLQGRAMNGG